MLAVDPRAFRTRNQPFSLKSRYEHKRFAAINKPFGWLYVYGFSVLRKAYILLFLQSL